MKARHEFDNDADYNEYIRTHFAACAMQGLLEHAELYMDRIHLAEDSVLYADVLIDALNKETK